MGIGDKQAKAQLTAYTHLSAITAMNIKKLLPGYVVQKLYELKEMHNRLQRLEVYTNQFHSLLQLNNQLPAIPPAHLQIRVSGDYYNDFFLHGQSLLNKLDDGLASAGIDRKLTQFDNVLDFGCGCGRTLIPLALRSLNPAGIHGVDIDPEAIQWLADHYPFIGSVKINPSWPPMPHDDATFDLLFAISVFTHLPEAMERAWLEEISRVLKPGGYALLTIHGEAFFDAIPALANHTVRQQGFSYTADDAITAGLPAFYKNSYHTSTYIRERWADYFDVIAIIPQGVDRQDLVILQKR